MPQIIEKKVWPEYFDKLLSGEKTYELRLADFEVNPGDSLLLKEWNPETKTYTGRELLKKVTYVGKTKDMHFWTQAEVDRFGYQIISLSYEKQN